MGRSRSGGGTEPNSIDRALFDADGPRLSVGTLLGSFVPPSVAQRAIAVSVATARDVYERDESVEIVVEFKNRLPVPVELPTPRQRRWGWTVDGDLEASDERLYTRDRPSSFDFRAGEKKRMSVTWNGRLERVRTDGRRESVIPDPGEYEIRAFVATREGATRPSDSTSIRLE
ncbi:hypothetical protein [Natrinema halophilum]|uniref:DUF7974 domain-containing protein n=1 Tax=Natrinema halophilum TaxID=1699371 RepID=A0A7D5KDX9_9EURY|nr:hypothetical protein [Natrinema halophilum]QLG49716.1 hypothetical protein HYG82_13005 [Natrinema halophilum]